MITRRLGWHKDTVTVPLKVSGTGAFEVAAEPGLASRDLKLSAGEDG